MIEVGNGIVMICSDGPSTIAIYHALKREFGEISLVVEKPMSRWQMIRKRVRKLGVLQVAGQVLFASVVVPALSHTSQKRIAEIEHQFGLSAEWGDPTTHQVETVNSDETIELISSLKPRIVIVNGTRIIERNVLGAVDALFLNTHAGITPLYRGVHGAYWALAEQRPELVGTTVHLVDEGIDTGNVIDQAFFEVTEKDNFATYPYLHTAAGIPILIKAVDEGLKGQLKPGKGLLNLPSRLRYHPTIWEYIFYRFKLGIK